MISNSAVHNQRGTAALTPSSPRLTKLKGSQCLKAEYEPPFECLSCVLAGLCGREEGVLPTVLTL